jgi:hypothetical protein
MSNEDSYQIRNELHVLGVGDRVGQLRANGQSRIGTGTTSLDFHGTESH